MEDDAGGVCDKNGRDSEKRIRIGGIGVGDVILQQGEAGAVGRGIGGRAEDVAIILRDPPVGYAIAVAVAVERIGKRAGACDVAAVVESSGEACVQRRDIECVALGESGAVVRAAAEARVGIGRNGIGGGATATTTGGTPVLLPV